ncbi:hypothetical protein OROGR_006350 [Orobanche gracilis]
MEFFQEQYGLMILNATPRHATPPPSDGVRVNFDRD